ncbi:MAG: Stage sporulation protein [Verrucomicrobiota bacterium]|jgi:cell division protein FtsI/penicillin-binding protein 2
MSRGSSPFAPPDPTPPPGRAGRPRQRRRLTEGVRPTHLRRLLGFAVVTACALVLLGAWLYVLQVVLHGRFRDVVADQTQRVVLKQPRRGDILDVRGHKLATCEPVKRVLADPSLIHPHQAEVARALAPLLSLPEGELLHALRLTRTNELGRVVTNRFVDLKRKLSLDQWGQATQALDRVVADLMHPGLNRKERNALRAVARRGVFAEEDYRRVYPGGRLAAHVLGFVQEVERLFTNSATRVSAKDIVGIYGIEHSVDAKLKGSGGWQVTETDRRQREVVIHRTQDIPPKAGLTAVLTLDSFIQDTLETQLGEAVRKYLPKSACGMVIRPRTGEILAMASLPDFDPNTPGLSDESSRRNRLIADMHEPGSTFKIVVVSASLHEQKTHLKEVIYCENGSWLYRGKPLRDHGQYKDLTVEQIITKSSNIGSAKLAVQRLGDHKLHDYVAAFGFGTRTGIPLTGEAPGILRPVSKWDGLTITRIPMGQAVASTPIQMAMAMAAIANEGRLMRPMLIQGFQDADGRWVQRFQPQVVRQVISPRAARDMTLALKTVTTAEGTAPKAALDHHTVAGKTGTAQVADRGGYAPGRYVASFIGFFPAENPEVCISIVVEEPDVRKGYYGGQIAAPYFKAVAEQVANYLQIRPDKDDVLAASTTNVVNTAARR